MSIITNGKPIWISKEAFDYIQSKKKIKQEPIHCVIDRIFRIEEEL